jgi:phosphatidylserine decarboxylase
LSGTNAWWRDQPQAIRSALDVYGENVRKIVPIDSPQFGRVMVVCVGAMMVGSIKITVQEGQDVKRGQELGYFAFGKQSLSVFRGSFSESIQGARRSSFYSSGAQWNGMRI